jgi:hypothetical protein
MIARPFALHACAAILLWARFTSAQSPLSLRWTAPADCPAAEEVRRLVMISAGSEPVAGEPLDAEAEVRSLEIDGVRRYRVELSTRRGSERGERSIDAATCRGVAEATALVLSLALTATPSPSDDGAAQPSQGGGVPISPPASQALAPAAAETSPARVAPSRSAPARARAAAPVTTPARAAAAPTSDSHDLALGVSLAGDTATLPSAAAGGALSLAWYTGPLRLELEARRWLSQSRTDDAFAAGARFSMTSIGARGCWAAAAGESFDLGPCGGADVHMISAPGYGVEPDYDASAEWTALAAGAQGRLFVASWLALRARLEAAIPLSRPIFVLEGGGPLHQPAALGGAAGIGAELLFF